MKNKSFRGGFPFFSLFLLCVLTLFNACSFAPVGTSSLLSDSGSGNIGTDDTPESSDPAPEEPQAMPPVSILPTLQKPNVESIIPFAPDSLNYSPVIGFENAVPASWTDEVTGTTTTLADSDGDGIVDNYQVAVASESLEMSLAGIQPSLRATFGSAAIQTIKQFLDRHVGLWPPRDDLLSLIPSAHATALNVATDENTTPICERSGVTCCDIAMATLSFECYHTVLTNTDPMYVYLTDNTYVSDSLMMNPNNSLLWFAENPKQVVAGDSLDGGSLYNAFSLVEGRGIHIQEVGGQYQVKGDYTQGYEFFETDGGEQMGYDLVNETIGVRDDASGIYRDLFDGVNVADNGVATTPDAESYTVVKYTAYGKLMYGIKPKEEDDNQKKGKIYGVVDGTEIVFLDSVAPTDNDINGVLITHLKTLTFDVDTNGIAVALFQDLDNNFRLRAGYKPTIGTAVRFGGTSPLVGPYTSYDFKDLGIYHSENLNQGSENSGYAFLLDSANNTLWQVEFKYDKWIPYNHGLTSTLDTTKSLTTGPSPIAMAFNSNRTKVYVLNSGDSTVSVFTIANDDGSIKNIADATASLKTIDLKTYFTDKSITYAPISLTYQNVDSNEYLLVGFTGLKGSVVVDLSKVQ